MRDSMWVPPGTSFHRYRAWYHREETMARGTSREKAKAATCWLHLGLELGLDKWVLCFSNGKKFRWITLRNEQASVKRLLEEAGKARKSLGLSGEVRAMCSYEAGRHGFSVHRELVAAGVESQVVDSASIEVPRRKRRNKTDRIDAKALVKLQMRWAGGEKDALRVVRVPTVEQEDERRPEREIHRLKKERTAQTNRIKALLLLAGVRVRKLDKKFAGVLEKARQFDGSPLPPHLLEEVRHSYERRCLAERQMQGLRKARRERLRTASERLQAKQEPRSYADRAASGVVGLSRLYGIGAESAWLLMTEFFGWRDFKNRRQVAGSGGLVTTVHLSCTVQQDQGISKAGNPRVRWMLQEIAWSWLRFQPESELTKWYNAKFGAGTSRQRRTGAVALARRLVVDLWKYVAYGVIPKGARLKGEVLAQAA